MKRSGYSSGWVVIGVLSLILTNPIYAVDTNSSKTQEDEAPARPLKRPAPTTVKPATEGTKPAPATATPRAATPVAPAPTAPRAVAPPPTAPRAEPTPAAPQAAPQKPAGRTPTRAAPTAATLTIISPNGGETYAHGSRVQVQWQADGISGPGAIHLLQHGRKVADIAVPVNLSQGQTSWRVPADIQAGSGYTVRIQSRDGKYADISDQTFTIGTDAAGTRLPGAKLERGQRPATASSDTETATEPQAEQPTPAAQPTPATPALSFISPASNTRWCTNQSHEYRWHSTLPAGSNVRIDWMQGNTIWRTIVASTPDTGSYVWPGYTDAQFGSGMGSFRPRISTTDNSVVHLGETLHFGKPLWINAPQSNHTWRKGSQYTLRWTQLCDLPAPAVLELLDSNQQPVLTIADGLTATGHHLPHSHTWTVPGTLEPGTYYFRVRSADNQLSSSGSFKIANPVSFPVSPDLTFTSPAQDTAWCTNLPHEFRWNSTLPADTRVKIDLMDGNGETVWRSIVADIPNSGSYTWAGYTDAQFGFGMGTFRPRIATMDNTTITVGEFLHIGKHLFLEAPKSNYTWRHGSSYDILWTQLCDLPAPVVLELLDAGKQPVATIASGLGSAGSSRRQLYKWTVPATLAPGTYYVRVRSADGQHVQEGSFTIATPVSN